MFCLALDALKMNRQAGRQAGAVFLSQREREGKKRI
jgi:hypothetical protein